MNAALTRSRTRSDEVRHLSRRGRDWLRVSTAIAILVWCGHSASAQSERVQELVMRALALQPDERQGRALYVKHCSACHGNNAEGDANTATPVLAGQIGSYVIKQLADLAEGQRDVPEMHTRMARIELGQPQAMRDLSSFLGALPADEEVQHGDGMRLALGADIYKSACAQCHGARGEGDEERAIPAVRGQHYSYLLRQARQLASAHRYAVDIPVIVLLDGLSLDQLTAVSDFMSRLPATDQSEVLAADRS